MLSSRPVAALFGALSLTLAAFTVAPASAAPVGAGPVEATQAGTDLVQKAWHYGRPHRYRPRPPYYGRPIYRPRCFFTDRRVWNGYRWVIRPVRICR